MRRLFHRRYANQCTKLHTLGAVCCVSKAAFDTCISLPHMAMGVDRIIARRSRRQLQRARLRSRQTAAKPKIALKHCLYPLNTSGCFRLVACARSTPHSKAAVELDRIRF